VSEKVYAHYTYRGRDIFVGYPAEFPALTALALRFGDTAGKIPWRQRLAAAALLLKLAGLNAARTAPPEYTVADLADEFKLSGPQWAELVSLLSALSPEEAAMYCAAITAQLAGRIREKAREGK
jgi:hypothetical protein